MNCQQANELDMNQFLAEQGHKPHRESSHGNWYLSPLRDELEKVPSFKVERNMFHDFATNRHGKTVDLAILLWRCSVSDALKRLNNKRGVPFASKPVISTAKGNGIRILEIKPITSKPLFAYLWSRGIHPELAKKYLKELSFEWNGGKPQYALGFENDSHGWEIRNSICKLCSSPKDITSILRNSNKVLLFEGFFDFLSYVQLKKEIGEVDIIVLNSVVLLEKTFGRLKGYNSIKCFLDNDEAGRACLNKIKTEFGSKVYNCSNGFVPTKDLNEYLIQRNSERQKVPTKVIKSSKLTF